MMSLIAMLAKEWRRLLRAPSSPWLLAAYVVLPAAVAAVYLKTAGRSPMGMMPQFVPLMGAQALSNVAAWQILLLAVWAPWQAAGMLAAEVEDRTLEPFLASGGRLIGAVAGKFLATVMFFGFVILAGLPAFALPMLIGGINWGLIGRVAALEGATVLMMTGLGLVLSGFGRRAAGTAMAGAALGLALTLGTALALNMTGVGGDVGGVVMVKGMMMPAAPGQPGTLKVPKWLYANPLVGLNAAVDNGAPALVTIPGDWTRPVYKKYRLWHLQIAGGCALGVVGVVLSWLAMSVRLRWRRPAWLMLWRRRKAVAVSG